MEENPPAPDVVKDDVNTTVGTKNNTLSPPLGNPQEKPRREDQPRSPEEPSVEAENR
jgi:hypothetical protein